MNWRDRHHQYFRGTWLYVSSAADVLLLPLAMAEPFCLILATLPFLFRNFVPVYKVVVSGRGRGVCASCGFTQFLGNAGQGDFLANQERSWELAALCCQGQYCWAAEQVEVTDLLLEYGHV